MKRAVQALSLLVLLAGVGLAVTPASAVADTCTAGNGSICHCVGTCSAGPAECFCGPPKT